MLSSSWDKNDGITRRVLKRVKSEEPIKNRVDFAQKNLECQITKLKGINDKIQKKHDMIFEKIVNAQRDNKTSYAQAYAVELAQVRKMKNMVGTAKLSMEQIKLRLGTVSELGDIVVTLSPCMSIIKGLAPSLKGIVPEANASMQNLSQILGDVMSGSSVSADSVGIRTETNADTLAILEEAHDIIAGQARSAIPEVPDSLSKHVAKKRSGILF